MFSIITPAHPSSSKWIRETYESLLSQTFTDWQWILLLNSGLSSLPIKILNDERVRVYEDESGTTSIGQLKKTCASYATHEIIVELDADDLLTPDALECLSVEYTNPDVGFVYSNSASFNSEDGSPVTPFSSFHGWKTREFPWNGQNLNEMIAWGPSPHMMRDIFWAPDHVRSWRRSVYEEIGGHDASLSVGDDHDLCMRSYIHLGSSGIRHIDKCLYLYRIHGNNTHITDNQSVRDQSTNNYIRHGRSMMVKWAQENELRTLDLGGRFEPWVDFETVDLLDADIVTDLNRVWPFEDNSVGVIRASHIFEHLIDPIHAMNEAFRVLAPGGWLLLEVPSTDGRGAFQDPTHVSFWNQNSIRYYTDSRWSRYIRPMYKGRFQDSRTITFFPFNDESVPVVQSDMIAVKGGYADRFVGGVYD
jgi:O-antigen biosynthesis protein